MSIDDHAKSVAKRNSNKNEKEFKHYLKQLGWDDDDIKAMWQYNKLYLLNKKKGG